MTLESVDDSPSRAASSSDQSARVLRILEEYMAVLERGGRPDPEGLLAQYPDLAEVLGAYLRDLDQLHGAAVNLRDSLPSRAGQASADPIAETECLGDFRLLREIGRGGMGVVYEAEQRSLGRRVALKVLPMAAALDPKQLQRFQVEAHAAACLHHTNIVPIHAVGCDRGVPYYAMQLIEGRSLADLIRELRRADGLEPADANGHQDDALARSLAHELSTGCLAPLGRDTGPAVAPEGPSSAPGTTPSSSGSSTRSRPYINNVARLGIQAAEALEHAHQRGVLHRDIKPANLLLDAQGTLWVTDFGLARIPGEASLTATGDLLGTLRYMSPEQAVGRRVLIDGRTDIYSLGVTLYELLTLQPAVAGKDRQEVLRQIADQDPRSPRRLNPSVPADLETIVLKAIAKEPASRYATAQVLADDLRRFLEDKPIKAKRPSLVERAAKWSRRHRSFVASAMVLLVVGVVGLAIAAALISAAYRSESRQRQRAEGNLRLALQALDETYMRVEEDRLPRSPQDEKRDREFLENALRFYEQFARENADNVAVWEETARAYHSAGRILNNLGRHDDAERAYRRGLDLRDRLLSRDPSRANHRRDLAQSYVALAWLCFNTGRLREAKENAGRVRDFLSGIGAESSNDPAQRQRLVNVLSDLGPLMENVGDLQGAEAALRQLSHLCDTPAALATPADHLILAHALDNLSLVLRGTKRSEEASQSVRRAIEILEKLVEEDPSEYRARKYLAICLVNRGLDCDGKPDLAPEAERIYRRAIELNKGLVAEFPGAPDYQSHLSLAYIKLGSVLGSTNRIEEEEKVYRLAVELEERLATDFPSRTLYRSHYGMALNDLATVLLDKGESSEALRLLRQAVVEQQAALKVDPGKAQYRAFLRNHYANLAVALTALGDHKEAAVTAAAMAGVFPPNSPHDAFYAASFIARCAILAEDDLSLSPADRTAQAQSYAAHAADILKRAGDRVPDHADFLTNVAWLLVCGPSPGIYDPARAAALARRAVALSPKSGPAWNTLGVAHYREGSTGAAVEALEKSMALTSGGSCNDWFFLAMAHWRRGDAVKARAWYDKAVARMDAKHPELAKMKRFRAEAAALLGVPELPVNVFAGP